jgi:hypothetical protein
MPTEMPRIYVPDELNKKIDSEHFAFMARCGYRISKAEFVQAIFEIGLANKTALYTRFPQKHAG